MAINSAHKKQIKLDTARQLKQWNRALVDDCHN